MVKSLVNLNFKNTSEVIFPPLLKKQSIKINTTLQVKVAADCITKFGMQRILQINFFYKKKVQMN